MFRHDQDDEIVPALLMGEVLQVEALGNPIEMLVLTFAAGRRIIIHAVDSELILGEEGVAQC